MFWQYLVEIRVPFAILVAVMLAGLGYGACWILLARPWKKRAGGAAGQAGRDAADRRGEMSRLPGTDSQLQQRTEQAQAGLAEEQRRLRAVEAECDERTESLAERLKELERELAEKNEELGQAHRRIRLLAAQEGPPQGTITIRKEPAGAAVSPLNDQEDGSAGSSGSGLAGGLGWPGPCFIAGRVVLVRKRALNLTQTSAQPPVYLVDIVVERAEVPPDFGRLVNEVIKREQSSGTGFDDKLSDALAEYTAKRIGEPIWHTVAEHWATVESGGLDAVAHAIEDFQAGVHEALLGKPAESVMKLAGTPPAAAAPASGVVAEIPLPIDHPLTLVDHSISVAEILVGMVPPRHPLAVHGMQRLAHDLAISALKQGVAQLEAIAAEPPAPRPASQPPAPPRPHQPRPPGTGPPAPGGGAAPFG